MKLNTYIHKNKSCKDEKPKYYNIAYTTCWGFSKTFSEGFSILKIFRNFLSIVITYCLPQSRTLSFYEFFFRFFFFSQFCYFVLVIYYILLSILPSLDWSMHRFSFFVFLGFSFCICNAISFRETFNSSWTPIFNALRSLKNVGSFICKAKIGFL